MIPKSTSKLKPGDFCFIPREDGLFVPFAFLCAPANTRSFFYGGILDALIKEPNMADLPPKLIVKQFALLHIGCFKENNTPIVGNVADRIGSETLQAIKLTVSDFSIGSTSSVWGYRTILKYAAAVEA